jgi:hypothetical protein
VLSLETVIILVLQLVIVIYGIFINVYIKKRAENLATLNDIDKITTSVEEVKFEFTKLLEQEKINNALIQERTLKYNQRIDEILFECFKDTTEFKATVIDIDYCYFIVDENYNHNLQSKINEINKCHDLFKLNIVKLSAFYGANSIVLEKYEEVNLKIGKIAIKWYNLSTDLSNINSDTRDGKLEFVNKLGEGYQDLINLYCDKDNDIDDALTEFANQIKKHFENSPK